MTTGLTAFEEIDGLQGIACATKGTLRCTAIRLKDDRLCLFSPVPSLSEPAKGSLNGLGDVQFLLAPNHYHNKGLTEYASAYPAAKLITSQAARPRLEKVTGCKFSDLGELLEVLPAHVTVLHPTGLKTGEIWLRVEGNGAVAWNVVDAFCTTKENSKAPVSETPELLGTFPKMGVADSQTYHQWVEQQLERDNVSMVIPCHGSIIKSDTLNGKLSTLMQQFR